ncbi:retrovirus-related pol polyprotein from transposon TNT 1-94 [Tanacetum coccineum]
MDAQPNGFLLDPNHPEKVYHLRKALYRLKQAPRAWYDKLSNFLRSKGFTKGTINPTLFMIRYGEDILLVQIYVDDIIFGSTNPKFSKRFEKLMHRGFEMSLMEEMKLFLGLQIHQSPRELIIVTIKPVPVSQAENPPLSLELGTSFGFHPFQSSYHIRKLTMEEMLYKFIDEGRREHEEMGAFIREFKTTNELLLKERNNSLSELNFKVYGLSKAINDAQLSNYEVKGVTTRGGKTTTKIIRHTNDINKELLILHHDKPVESNEVLVETKHQKRKEQTIQPPTPLIPFPHMLKKEKEEAQQ